MILEKQQLPSEGTTFLSNPNEARFRSSASRLIVFSASLFRISAHSVVAHLKKKIDSFNGAVSGKKHLSSLNLNLSHLLTHTKYKLYFTKREILFKITSRIYSNFTRMY